MKFTYVAIVALLMFSFLSFASTPITGCTQINSSGDYVLANDVLGAGIPSTSAGGNACIRIASSDVSLDCQGHTLTGESAGSTHGILIESPTNAPLSNININNCTITNYGTGIFAPTQTSSSSFTNLNISNNVGYGFYVWALSGSVVANSTSSRNGESDFYFALTSNNNQILNNTATFSGHQIGRA